MNKKILMTTVHNFRCSLVKDSMQLYNHVSTQKFEIFTINVHNHPGTNNFITLTIKK